MNTDKNINITKKNSAKFSSIYLEDKDDYDLLIGMRDAVLEIFPEQSYNPEKAPKNIDTQSTIELAENFALTLYKSMKQYINKKIKP